MNIKTIPPNAKYIVMSDCHRGNGADEDWRDNPAPLRTLFPDIQINGDILGRGKMRDCALLKEKPGRLPRKNRGDSLFSLFGK